jgi:hypothetical protein
MDAVDSTVAIVSVTVATALGAAVVGGGFGGIVGVRLPRDAVTEAEKVPNNCTVWVSAVVIDVVSTGVTESDGRRV